MRGGSPESMWVRWDAPRPDASMAPMGTLRVPKKSDTSAIKSGILPIETIALQRVDCMVQTGVSVLDIAIYSS